MCDVSFQLIRTDVTAVKFVKNEIFAGVGGFLHIFNTNPVSLIAKIKIFDDKVIHGVIPNDSLDNFLIFGENSVKVYIYKNCLTEKSKYVESDWILSARWLNNNECIALLTIHNKIRLFTNDFSLLKEVICEEPCILYSAALINDTWNNLIVLSGTVFNQILIWWPFRGRNGCNILTRLKGHNGVIFSICYNKNNGYICSTSDDRSAIIWSVQHRDLIAELQQPQINITKKCCVTGHLSRIFRSIIWQDYFITAGEDSVLNFWDFNGNLIKKIETGSANVIWALDCSEDGSNVVVGGSNCGVTVYSTNIHKNFSKTLLEDQHHKAKQIGLLKSGNLIVMCENGMLKYYKKENGDSKWINIKRHEEFKTYAIVEVSFNRQSFIIAGFHGDISLYEEKNFTVQCVVKTKVGDNKRIFSVHWLTNKSFLLCLPNGELQLWFLWHKFTVFNKYQLPYSKERWSTAACLLNRDHFVVGDRKGNLYLYKINEVNGQPLQTISKAHNYLGITHIREHRGKLISLGRNSIINVYSINKSKLIQESSDKVPFTWLVDLKNNGSMLLAFSASDFVVWNYNRRQTLWEINCGGGHRSWDFAKIDSNYVFAFVKDKSIYEVFVPTRSAFPVELMGALHSKEINSVCIISHLPNLQKCVCVYGGEDTNLVFCEVSLIENPYELKTLRSFKSHLSSIRAITSHLIEKTDEYEIHLVFSSGGRGQLILWKVYISTYVVHFSEEYSFYENTNTNESETRIMDLKTEQCNGNIVVFAACSDGNIKVFKVNASMQCEKKYSLSLVTQFFYDAKCILKLSVLHVRKTRILCSMATDGKIQFWNIDLILDKILENDGCIAKDESCVKIVGCLRSHQSGINSCGYRSLNDDQFVFVTGGDDNAISIALCQFTMKDKLILEVLSTGEIMNAHCAQITGVYLTPEHFITTSIDQRVIVFRWKVTRNTISYEKISVVSSHVADIQGMECFKINNHVDIVLYGKGMEMLKVKLI